MVLSSAQHGIDCVAVEVNGVELSTERKRLWCRQSRCCSAQHRQCVGGVDAAVGNCVGGVESASEESGIVFENKTVHIELKNFIMEHRIR